MHSQHIISPNRYHTCLTPTPSPSTQVLRKALDSSGHRDTKIIAGDVHSWAPAAAMLTDKALADSVAILARHYPGSHNDADSQRVFETHGTPLWSSEDFASNNNDGSGGRCEARILNQNWVRGNISATISWNLISSYYEYLAWPYAGLMRANTPWSGHYSIDPPIYACAHTTAFTSPGWGIFPTGAGSGLLDKGGSYVGYLSPNRSEFTLVIEKVRPQLSMCRFEATPGYNVANESATFIVPPSVRGRPLYLWRSNFQSQAFMVGGEAVAVTSNGTVRVMVAVDDLITLSTLSWEGPPRLPPAPPPSAFPSTVSESFEEYEVGQEPVLFAQMSGAFEVVQGGQGMGTRMGKRMGKVLRQSAVGPPVNWLRANIAPSTQVW